MELSHSMYMLIAVLSLLNFVRVLAMLIGSDIYDIKQIYRLKHAPKSAYRPLVTVVIPAYNEEVGVIRTVKSVLQSKYKRIQLLVVDDGSRDKTYAKLRTFQRKHRGAFTIIHQKNAGKAAAINRAVAYQCIINHTFQRNVFATAVSTITGNDKFSIGIIQPIRNALCAESAKYHAVDSTNPGTA